MMESVSTIVSEELRKQGLYATVSIISALFYPAVILDF